MSNHTSPRQGLICLGAFFVAGLLAFSPGTLAAQTKSKNAAGRLYVASLEGSAQINRGEKIEGLKVRGAYLAEGSILETEAKSTNALVYSNGTGLFVDPDTRLEVSRFAQEPFTPNRADLEVEPSVSQTETLVARGTIGLCTSKLVAGSSMKYSSTFGSVSVQGGKLVIVADADETRISLLEGEALVRCGELDLGGRMLRPGEQARIRRGASSATVGPIPPSELAQLNDKIFMACAARKTVYFETTGSETAPEIVAVPVVPATVSPLNTVSPSQLPP